MRSLPLPLGNSPVRGNVCEADKRVPVFGEKGGGVAVGEGLDGLRTEKAVNGVKHSCLSDFLFITINS